MVFPGNDSSGSVIGLNERTRNRLKVKEGEAYDFEMRPQDFCGQVQWALEASDISYRFTATIAIASWWLDILAIVLAVVSIIKA